MTTTMALIAARNARAIKLHQAKGDAHHAARLISADATTVDLRKAASLLQHAADLLEAVRHELQSAELKAAPSEPIVGERTPC